MKSDLNALPNIIIRSLQMVLRHFYLYFIPLPYIIIAGIVLVAIMYIGIVVIFSGAAISLFSINSIISALSIVFSSFVFAVLFMFVIACIFITGYFGGLGQMLKVLLTSNRARIGEFTSGVFRYGPRLFFGLIAFIVLIGLPSYWGFERVIATYSVYDFATMDSGWNSQLQDALSRTHIAINFQTRVLQVIITVLLGFWWVACITETRHFIVSFYKSVVFMVQNPVTTLVVLVGSIACFLIFSSIFASIFSALNLGRDFGWLIGAYIYIPVMVLIMFQTYDPRFQKAADAVMEPKPGPELEIELHAFEPKYESDLFIEFHDKPDTESTPPTDRERDQP